jgi:hypothetical protein
MTSRPVTQSVGQSRPDRHDPRPVRRLVLCHDAVMDLSSFKAAASVVVAAPAEEIYAFIGDMPRIGEISPECTGGVWESEARDVGALFIGSNTSGDRTWQRRIQVVVADAPSEFAWENIGDANEPFSPGTVGAARWTYRFTPVEGGTRVDETWYLLENPHLQTIAEDVLRGLESRNQAGMEQTLVTLRDLFEA